MLFEVVGVGIERLAGPLDHLGMAFVLRVANCLEELGIARRAAGALRRVLSGPVPSGPFGGLGWGW